MQFFQENKFWNIERTEKKIMSGIFLNKLLLSMSEVGNTATSTQTQC